MENTCLWFLSQFVGCARLAVLLFGLHVLALAGSHVLLVEQPRRVELPVLTDHLRGRGQRESQTAHRSIDNTNDKSAAGVRTCRTA